MASSEYEAVVTTRLAAASIGLTLGTNLFRGKMRSRSTGMPAKAVFCLLTGGPEPEAYCNNATFTKQVRRPTVQVMVRSNPREWEEGYDLARSVFDAIHDVTPAGYIAMRCLQATPLPLAEQEDGSYVWSINVGLIISE